MNLFSVLVVLINYLLTFATLPPHTRLLNIILKHFYSASTTDFRFYHTTF